MEQEIVNVTGTEGKWKYVSSDVTVGSSVGNLRRCQVCGNSNRRFSHHLVYPKELGNIRGTYENHIFVGVDCAAVLIDGDPVIPRLAEAETQRKERWRIRYNNPGECHTTIEHLEERGKL